MLSSKLIFRDATFRPTAKPSLICAQYKWMAARMLGSNPLAAWQVDLEIAMVNEEGLRGARAIRDMKRGQVAVKLPKVMAATLSEWNLTSEVSRL